MKPPERLPANDPLEWLNHARSNLALARNRVPGAEAVELAELVVRWVEDRLTR